MYDEKFGHPEKIISDMDTAHENLFILVSQNKEVAKRNTNVSVNLENG